MTTDEYNHTSPTQDRIGIIGLGFVGLPLAILFANKGFNVTGIDTDDEKVRKINNGISYIPDIIDSEVASAVTLGRLCAETSYNNVTNLDVIIICVPTPLTEFQTPDLSYLQHVGLQLSPHLQKGQLIVLESSTYPGTTTEILQPILEKSGLETGRDFHLAYSPERIDPGNKSLLLQDIPKIVSGVTENCKQKINHLYSQVFTNVVNVTSPETAELAKLLENSYRFINISFINEIAMLCDALKLNIWEVIEAANTKPYGFNPFYPGPGIGGHCIPVDPLYLTWKAKQYMTDVHFLDLATKTNKNIRSYIIEQIKMVVSPDHKIAGKEILIVGVAYKKDIGDVRESPAISMIDSLLSCGAKVSYYDPFVKRLTIGNHQLSSISLTNQALENADCVVIVTDHSNLPVEQIVESANLIYDTRNVTKGLQGKGKIVRLGGGGA